jgi:signal peptidase II
MILNTKKRDIKSRLLPLVLSAGVILLDQCAKLAVVLTIPKGNGITVLGDFFRIIHVQNPAIAFSIGRAIAAGPRRTLFSLLPLVVIVILFLYYLLTRDPLTRFQKWTFAALLGGGLGNYVDRIFRPDGVVDFLDFKFYGIFGLERWPTFNVADMTVVITGIMLFISFLIPTRQTGETQ